MSADMEDTRTFLDREYAALVRRLQVIEQEATRDPGGLPYTAWVASVGTSHASPGEDATQVRPPAAPAYGRYGPAPALGPGTVPLTAPLTGGQGRLVWLRRVVKVFLIGLGILAAGLTVAVALLLILAAAWLLWWPT